MSKVKLFSAAVILIFFVLVATLFVYIHNKNVATLYAISFGEINKSLQLGENNNDSYIRGSYHKAIGGISTFEIKVSKENNLMRFTFTDATDYIAGKYIEYSYSQENKNWSCIGGNIPENFYRVGCAKKYGL